jgi:hypothetical protein
MVWMLILSRSKRVLRSTTKSTLLNNQLLTGRRMPVQRPLLDQPVQDCGAMPSRCRHGTGDTVARTTPRQRAVRLAVHVEAQRCVLVSAVANTVLRPMERKNTRS